MKDNDNSVFFLTLSLLCVWLIVDYIMGKKYVAKFISMLPFMGGSNVSSTSTPIVNIDPFYDDYSDDKKALIKSVGEKLDNGVKWSDLTPEEQKIAKVYASGIAVIKAKSRG